MKTCPICGSKAVDSASTCFECLYSFVEHSAEACYLPKSQTEEDIAQEERATATESAQEEIATAAGPMQEEACKISKPASLTPQDVTDIFVELWQRGTLTRRYLSHNGSLYVGSARFNDIDLPLSKVAKRAVHIYRDEMCVFAEVLDATFPIFLNGKKLDGAVPIKPNDVLSFEDIRLVLV